MTPGGGDLSPSVLMRPAPRGRELWTSCLPPPICEMGDLHRCLALGLMRQMQSAWAQSAAVRNQLTSFVKHFPLFAHLFGCVGLCCGLWDPSLLCTDSLVVALGSRACVSALRPVGPWFPYQESNLRPPALQGNPSPWTTREVPQAVY